jgi:hypothetical protein
MNIPILMILKEGCGISAAATTAAAAAAAPGGDSKTLAKTFSLSLSV